MRFSLLVILLTAVCACAGEDGAAESDDRVEENVRLLSEDDAERFNEPVTNDEKENEGVYINDEGNDADDMEDPEPLWGRRIFRGRRFRGRLFRKRTISWYRRRQYRRRRLIWIRRRQRGVWTRRRVIWIRRRIVLRKCHWSTCSTRYSVYTPQPSQGSCVWQRSKANHIYTTHSRYGSCPRSSKCSTKDKTRYWCSCKQISSCWWADWGPWTGSISPGKCGTQTRYRKGKASYRYVGKLGNCNGVVSKCPRDVDSKSRRWCNCRKAEICRTGKWTNWAPTITNGKCVKQTRYQNKIPTYKYVQQVGSCFGINPNCPPRLMDRRTLCSCSYKQCIESSWTAWKPHTWVRNCPTERRLKKYRSVTKYKTVYGSCVGIGPQTCPNSIAATRDKDIRCPKLSIPANAVHKGSACNGINSKCKAICQITCKKGFQLKRNRYVTCQGNGKWSGQQGYCRDVEAPKISCPSGGTLNNAPNKHYRIINIPKAHAVDNTGINPKLTISHKSPLKVYVGSPVRVRYTATDSTGNSKYCQVNFQVKDNEPPKVVTCPPDKVYKTGKVPYQVFWKDPTFHDNVDSSNLYVFTSVQNGAWFSRGSHKITYLARDKALNSVTCKFTIQIELMRCPMHNPPKHGSAVCNIRRKGATETHICSVACNQNAWFINGPNIPTLYHYYVCGENGQWRGQNKFSLTQSVHFTPIPKGQTPWPDCAVGQQPYGVTMEFQIFGGNCGDQQQMQQLKKILLNAIKNDLIMNSLYCSVSATHCAIDNFRVYCSNEKKQTTGSIRKKIVVKFSLTVRDTKPSYSLSIERNKLKMMTTKLNKQKILLINKLKKSAASALRDKSVSVTAINTELVCQPGYEYKIINGKQSTSNRVKCYNNLICKRECRRTGKMSCVAKETLDLSYASMTGVLLERSIPDTVALCVKCPGGTHYNRRTNKCVVCSVGHYQENEGVLSCKKCPKNMSTHVTSANNLLQCKEICGPGTYSSTGLATCLACPISTYQPYRNNTSCISCPSGKVTSSVGATAYSDCSQSAGDVMSLRENMAETKNVDRDEIGIVDEDHDDHDSDNVDDDDDLAGDIVSNDDYDGDGDDDNDDNDDGDDIHFNKYFNNNAINFDNGGNDDSELSSINQDEDLQEIPNEGRN